MTRYKSFDPNLELNGRTTSAFIVNIKYDDIAALLIKHGLNDIDPMQWYNMQKVLDVMTEISENVNASENLVAVGMAAGQLALDNLPPQYVDMTTEQWLRTYCEQLYPTRHRGGYCGEMVFQVVTDTHYIITAHIPYPDDLMYGVFYAHIRHFMRRKQSFVLHYDPDVLRRELGGEKTIYHVVIQ